MKKKILGLTVLGTVVGAVTTGVRYANMKKAIRTGKVDGWIQDVLGNEVAYEIKSDIPTPAYITDDKSMIYFRFSDADLTKLAMSPQSFKDTVQAIAAHEKGHFVDPELELIQEYIQYCINKGDYEGYKRQVLNRERRAWELGKDSAPNKAFFDKYNRANMQMYKMVIASEKAAWK